ncbi:hypothetical protein PPTG_24347 [Phytophthora nicotianae INRA-310]|uniref:Acyltransferase 3 domain-containing protein n=1 Tax=Phytophthora nicotianae (strain INRA-310) TaxID=761204 RepID=W2PIT5_PHYN3|nr:hypothetical protein PPTG_24347 [Phytophthora nicotianae INRA-310]ETM99934.1 hypothetical protein PPTG_24347 [Phytophthora nicotianae INRA-310]
MMHAIQVIEDDGTKQEVPLQEKASNTTTHNTKITKVEEGFPRNKPNERPLSPVSKILFLDGVRGAAVVFVVTQHSGYMHDIFMGAVGVDAFFVLSSFLLTMIFMKKSIKLIAEAASYRKWGLTLIDYFSKRFFRVYPLFALLSITLWLMPFEYKNQYYLVKKPEDFNLFQTLTFHPEHRHYLLWTLPLEISYYFILPAFVLAVLKMGRFWWMSFIPLYAWVIHEGLYTIRDNFYRQPLSAHLPTFVAGSMAAVIFVKVDTWIKSSGFKFLTPHIVALRIVEAVLIAAYLSVVFRGLFFNWLAPPPSQLSVRGLTPRNSHYKRQKFVMSGVEQPLLSVASSNGAGSCQTQQAQRTRFLDRRGRFKQSLGRFNVYRKGGDWRKIYWDDPFHTVINTRTSRIIWGVFIAVRGEVVVL